MLEQLSLCLVPIGRESFLRNCVSKLGQGFDGVKAVWGVRVEKDVTYLGDPTTPLLRVVGGLSQHSPDADAILRLYAVQVKLFGEHLLDPIRIVQRQ
jgi:hypothetical protein